ncbi:MAG: NAD(P)H-dependent oxidoreductase [Bacteroidetes bacterium]|nr:NAD(P)H-dependent oxidoreductase [Bacteroidota bacterium]
MELLKNLRWRYATKRFDTSKKVSTNDLAKLKEAIQLSVSSYGLQLYKVLIIQDMELREELKPVSWNQNQITEASHLIVFCNYTDVNSFDIEEFIQTTSDIRGIDYEKLKGYGDFINSKLDEKSDDQKRNWLERQPYIALANLLMASAELKIDACPMEGFESEKYNEILGLNESGLNACVIAAIGYRSPEDQSHKFPKIRKPADKLFEEIEHFVTTPVI